MYIMKLQNVYKSVKPKYILWIMIIVSILLVISYTHRYFYGCKRYKEKFTVAMSTNEMVKQIVISPKPGYPDNWLHFGSFQIFDNQDKQLLPSQYKIWANTNPEIYQNNPIYGYDKLSDNNANTMFHSGQKDCMITFTLNNPTIIRKIIITQRPDCCHARLKGYKLFMKKEAEKDSILSETDLAGLPALYNSPYSDTITFTYPFESAESHTMLKAEDKTSTKEMTSICTGSNCEIAM